MKAKLIMLLIALICTLSLGAALSCGDDDDDDDDTSDDDDIGDDDDDDDDSSGEVWTDSSSGLMWQNSGTTIDLWHFAAMDCDDLNHAGYDDWRLPTISELRTLVRGCDATATGGSCGATDSCLDKSCADSTCNGCAFDEGPGSDDSTEDGCYWPSELNDFCQVYWSSSMVADDSQYVWILYFRSGGVGDKISATADMLHVRCVR